MFEIKSTNFGDINMTDSQSKEIKESNFWNPFISTTRDIERTEEIAKKNTVVAGVLSFFLLPAAMLYMNRGVNSLKILAYTICLAIPISGIIAESEDQAFSIGKKIGYIGNIAIIVENVNTINKAKKRKASSQA